jgi:hypothetical protein
MLVESLPQSMMPKMPHLLRLTLIFALLGGCARTPPPEVAPTPPPAAQAADTVPDEPAVDPALDKADRDLRLAITDALRLGIVRTIREPKPGLLRLEVGPAFTAASAEHNLRALFSAYTHHHPGLEQPPVLELVRQGARIGAYTSEGLLLEGEPADTAARVPTPAPAPDQVAAQDASGRQPPRRGKYYLSLGAGAGAADFTCSECDFEMSTAPSGFLAVGLRVSEGMVLGIEGTGWTKEDDRGRGTIYTAMATAMGYVLESQPVFLSLGLGYVGFKRPVAEGTYRADALGFSSRLGIDLGLGNRWALSPYVGIVGSFGRPQFDLDGRPSSIEAAIRNLQFGVAVTVR